MFAIKWDNRREGSTRAISLLPWFMKHVSPVSH
jgi:hypothetical protein